MKVNFFLPQIAQFNKSINLFCLIFLAPEFSFTTDTTGFHCFYIAYYTKISGISTSSFILLYSVNTLFTETSSSWLIYESIKVFEIRTSIVFKVSFPNNTIFSWFFLFFFIIDLHFLIPAVIAQILIPTAELLILTGTETNEPNAEIETQPIDNFEAKISKYST